MRKENVYTAVVIAIAAVIAVSLVALLVGALRTQFSPKPTEFPGTEWVSEDGAFRLTVGEYDNETYQCAAVLTYSGKGGEYAYTVADAPYSGLYVYEVKDEYDNWLRVRCCNDYFTVRINRRGGLVYSSEYDSGELIRFDRVN